MDLSFGSLHIYHGKLQIVVTYALKSAIKFGVFCFHFQITCRKNKELVKDSRKKKKRKKRFVEEKCVYPGEISVNFSLIAGSMLNGVQSKARIS